MKYKISPAVGQWLDIQVKAKVTTLHVFYRINIRIWQQWIPVVPFFACSGQASLAEKRVVWSFALHKIKSLGEM